MLVFILFSPIMANGAKKSTLGWLEMVTLYPWGAKFKAKLDTGAKTSSIHALHIEIFDQDGEEWVQFMMRVPNGKKMKKKLVKLPVERKVAVKRHGLASKKRPVVKIDFCLNGKKHEAEFTLTNRHKFNYPVLLGRRFLKDVTIVHPAKKYLSHKRCPKA